MAEVEQVEVSIEELTEALLAATPEEKREELKKTLDEADDLIEVLKSQGLVCAKPAPPPQIKSAGFDIDDFEKLAEGNVGHFVEEQAHEIDRGDHRIEPMEVDEDMAFLACDGCGMRPLPREAFVLHVNEKVVKESIKAKSYFGCSRACMEGVAVTAMVEKELLSEEEDGEQA